MGRRERGGEGGGGGIRCPDIMGEEVYGLCLKLDSRSTASEWIVCSARGE